MGEVVNVEGWASLRRRGWGTVPLAFIVPGADVIEPALTLWGRVPAVTLINSMRRRLRFRLVWFAPCPYTSPISAPTTAITQNSADSCVRVSNQK